MEHKTVVKLIKSLLVLLIPLINFSCTNNALDSDNQLNPEAAKIASEFKFATFQNENGNEMPYRFFDPSQTQTKKAKYPVILYLHGEDEAGTDNEKQITTTECATIWAEPDHLAENPVYILAPQLPEGKNWISEQVYSNTKSLLDEFINNNPLIDKNRIYIVGFSSGATGVWNMILKNPDLFAAALPISGNADDYLGDYDAWAALKNMPIYIVHSYDDRVSLISGSYNAASALQAAGNKYVSVGSPNPSFWGLSSVSSPHDAWYTAFHKYEVIYNSLFEQSLEKTNNGNISPTLLFSKKKLDEGITQVWDYTLGTAYVIENGEKAVIIDLAMGEGSIYQYIKDNVLTNKEIDIDIFITHNHFDHIVGLSSFVGVSQVKNVYVHKNDKEPILNMLGADAGKVKLVKEGDMISFGDKNMEVIEVPGHTLGSIVIKYENNVFTGDAIGSGDLWLIGSMPVENYIQSAQHLLDKIGNAKYNVWSGHTGEYRTPLTEEYLHNLITCAKGLVDGSIPSVPYWRTIGGMKSLGYAGTYSNATIVHDISNIKSTKGALLNLEISDGTLNPRFTAYKVYYSASVGNDVKTMDISPTVLDKNYKDLTINGVGLISGKNYNATLNEGENKFSIKVITSDNFTRTYTLTVTKGKQSFAGMFP